MRFIKRLIKLLEQEVDWKLAAIWLDMTIIFITFTEYLPILLVVWFSAIVYSSLRYQDSDDADNSE